MTCKKCKTNPVIVLPNSNVSLCKRCFLRYFERKVRRAIRIYKMFKRGDRVGVAVSGGKDSMSLLHILNSITKNMKGTKLVAILIDEGIRGYREHTRKFAEDYCKKNKTELHVYTFENEFGYSLDKAIKKLKIIPCSVCGVFRRYLLNRCARKLKVNRLATGHNLDDETQSILMNQFRNNIAMGARLGPVTGVKSDKRFVRRIKPFYFLTEKEIMTYAYLNGLTKKFKKCPHARGSYRNAVKDIIDKFDKRYPATKYSIINSFLEILPLLKKNYKTQKIKYCKYCSEPCSQEVCQKCEYVTLLKE